MEQLWFLKNSQLRAPFKPIFANVYLENHSTTCTVGLKGDEAAINYRKQFLGKNKTSY